MRNQKATTKSMKKLYEGLQLDYEAFRSKVRAFALESMSISNVRNLMTIAPANDKGMINGMTIPELVMLVNLSEGTGEHIVLRTTNNKQDLLVTAKKNLPPTTWGLL